MLRDPSLIPLSHQHHNGLALCVLTERSLREDAGEENVRSLARRVIERHEIELTNHFEIEEQILFPAIGEQLGDLALIKELIAEHRELDRMVADLREAPSAAILDEFVQLLRSHIRREERELFEEIQKHLPPGTLEALGRQIDAKVVRVKL